MHRHIYSHNYTYPYVEVTEIGDFSAIVGHDISDCPLGHADCKASGGALLDDFKCVTEYNEGVTLYTSYEEDTEGHEHSYSGIKIGAQTQPVLRPYYTSPHDWCDIYNPEIPWVDGFRNSTSGLHPTREASFETRTTTDGGTGAHHTHKYKSVNFNGYPTPIQHVVGFTTCSKGHTNCAAILGDAVVSIASVYVTPSTSQPIVAPFDIETLAAGWTAEIETKTPPASIDRTWALVRGELISLDAANNGVYLGFDYGKGELDRQQWYNPPSGATLVYNPLKFSINLGGLMPGTTYYYRAKAQLKEDINSALLRGSVTLNGEYEGIDTECYFEWGETAEYGNATSSVTKRYSGAFSKVITGLDPEITYHYRSVASNVYDTIYGEDMEFTALGVYYGEEESFQTLSAPPPIPPIFGLGNDYRSAKQAIENVADISLARSYVDNEGNAVYESRFKRRV